MFFYGNEQQEEKKPTKRKSFGKKKDNIKKDPLAPKKRYNRNQKYRDFDIQYQNDDDEYFD
jgi:hypothetical protein